MQNFKLIAGIILILFGGFILGYIVAVKVVINKVVDAMSNWAFEVLSEHNKKTMGTSCNKVVKNIAKDFYFDFRSVVDNTNKRA